MDSAQPLSWRFSVGRPQFLHLALYIRDATMLEVNPAPDIPPRLSWDLPQSDSPFSLGQRGAAAVQWIEWWHDLLDYEVNEARQSELELNDDPAYRAEMMASRQNAVFDPPSFNSLAAMPVLQTAVRARFAEGLERYNKWASQSPDSFPHETVRNAVESTARMRGIQRGRTRAVVGLLDVQGLWSYILAPGLALCSSSTALDGDIACTFLQVVFNSGVW